MSDPSRFCPVCGLAAPERFCPNDGTATVRRVRVDPRQLDYRPGHVVDGRYRLTRRIGHGGFGSVFAAVHTGTGQEVALKVLSVDLASDNLPIVRRFWQEAKITSALRHANTVRVFDVGQTEEGAFYLAMELLRGKTLADLLDERAALGQALSEAETCRVGIEACKSLTEAHRAGLVHRDLKPGNIMICDGDDGASQVKVLDFGIARTADSSLTGQGSTLGTPAYMSPEQCRGLPVDGRSDVYALAALLFRCVSSQPPFVDENPLAVLFHQVETPTPDVRDFALCPVTPRFAACLAKALAKRPHERFADAPALREELEGILGSSVHADATRVVASARPAAGTVATPVTAGLPPAAAPDAAPAAEPARWGKTAAAGAAVAALLAGGLGWALLAEVPTPARPAPAQNPATAAARAATSLEAPAAATTSAPGPAHAAAAAPPLPALPVEATASVASPAPAPTPRGSKPLARPLPADRAAVPPPAAPPPTPPIAAPPAEPAPVAKPPAPTTKPGAPTKVDDQPTALD